MIGTFFDGVENAKRQRIAGVFISENDGERIEIAALVETDESGEYAATSLDGRHWTLLDFESGTELIADDEFFPDSD